ncbi:hypothetical protein Tco_0959327 [Tanacetum coccineum]
MEGARVMTRGFGDLVAKLGDKVVMEVLVRCWSDGDVVVRSIIRNNEDNNETSIALMFKQVVIVEVFFAVIFQLAKNAVLILMLCVLNESGTKKYQGSNNGDGGNTIDGVKIAGGESENIGGIIPSLESFEELKEVLPDVADEVEV